MSVADTDDERPISPLVENWHYFASNRGALIGLIVFVVMVLVAILSPWIAPHDQAMQYRDSLLVPPVWSEGGQWRFFLGTDDLGRDLLSRIMSGARYSLLIGVIVVALSLSTGILVGLIAGYFGGRIDAIIMRIMDIILAFPSLLLALVLVAILGAGLTSAMIAIAVTLLPHFSRLTRGEVMAQKNLDYVTATKVAGAGNTRLMFSTILPNCLAPLIVQGTLAFSNAILDAAALGFLGMGAQPPTPEWGTMLAEARGFITSAWWVVTMPGIAILVTVIAINLIGDGLRDALDPKLKRS